MLQVSCFRFHASGSMLNTKPVKFLQSRPYHIKMLIFVFTMAIVGIGMFSFLASSLRNTFITATNNSDMANEKVIVVSKNKAPSLASNLKANIGELSGSIGGVFSGIFDSGSSSENIRRIKPVKLPIDRQ